MLKSERCNLHEASTEQEATNLGECPYDQVRGGPGGWRRAGGRAGPHDPQ